MKIELTDTEAFGRDCVRRIGREMRRKVSRGRMEEGRWVICEGGEVLGKVERSIRIFVKRILFEEGGMEEKKTPKESIRESKG